MKRDVWIVADNIVSPLGITSAETYQNIRAGKTGISMAAADTFLTEKVHAAVIHNDVVNEASTRFESIVLHSVRAALKQTNLDPLLWFLRVDDDGFIGLHVDQFVSDCVLGRQ